MQTTWEVVLTARHKIMRQARQFLAQHAIAVRHSTPRKAEGLLRVPKTDAPRARRLLTEWLQGKQGRVMEAWEASFFTCYQCGTALSLGSRRCPACNAFVGDPHGR